MKSLYIILAVAAVFASGGQAEDKLRRSGSLPQIDYSSSGTSVSESLKPRRQSKIIVPQEIEMGSLTPGMAKYSGPEIVKTCNGDVILFEAGAPTGLTNVIQKGHGGACANVTSGSQVIPLGSVQTVLAGVQKWITFLRTKSQAQLSSMGESDRSLIDVVSQYASSVTANESSQAVDFFPRIDPATVRLMFDLSYMAYYNKKDRSFTPNYVSTSYNQQLSTLKGRVAELAKRLDNIKQFRSNLSRVFGQDVIRYVEQKRIESQEEDARRHQGLSSSETDYSQSFGLHSGNTSSRMDFDQNYGGTAKGGAQTVGQDRGRRDLQQTETLDIKVRNLAPELIRAQAQTFNSLFNDPDEQIRDYNAITLDDIESRLGRIEGKTQHELIEAQRSLDVLSDPIAGDYWVKVERTFSRELEGFKPIDILYRNINGYKKPFIGAGFAASKRNDRSNLDGREVSGVILYRPAQNVDMDKNVDQMIISFSGSNSEADWLHNFNIRRSQGKANHSLATGYRVHQGIMDSLAETLDYMGTNLTNWFQNYVKTHPRDKNGEIPTLRIAVTGHSLGGGLALLMGLYIKDKIADVYEGRVNIDVVVYPFAAPPIFDRKFAQKAEDRLGKRNVIRVWNEGDPVSTLSIVFKNEAIFKRSLLMTLLGYAHIGTSVPLVDREGLASFFDKFNPWSNHLADRYANLLSTNWKDLSNHRAREIYEFMKSRNLLRVESLISILEDLGKVLRSRDGVVMPIRPEFVREVVEMMRDSDVKFQPQQLDNTIKNYDTIRDSRYSEGKTADPRLSGAEQKSLNYLHVLQTGQQIKMALTRSTTCSAADVLAKNGMNPRQIHTLDQSEISCGCCLAKNFFVSADSSLTSKFRSLFGKKISTIDQVYNHCSRYCSPLVGTLFSDKSKANVNEIGDLMDRMGLGDRWRSKRFID